jgi:hypothetical protein
MANFDKLFANLESMASGANTSCSDFTTLLEHLGFEIIDCNSGGHKIAKHAAVPLDEYPDFNCGHSSGATVNRPYVKKLHKFVKQHKEAIKEHMK